MATTKCGMYNSKMVKTLVAVAREPMSWSDSASMLNWARMITSVKLAMTKPVILFTAGRSKGCARRCNMMKVTPIIVCHRL